MNGLWLFWLLKLQLILFGHRSGTFLAFRTNFWFADGLFSGGYLLLLHDGGFLLDVARRHFAFISFFDFDDFLGFGFWLKFQVRVVSSFRSFAEFEGRLLWFRGCGFLFFDVSFELLKHIVQRLFAHVCSDFVHLGNDLFTFFGFLHWFFANNLFFWNFSLNFLFIYDRSQISLGQGDVPVIFFSCGSGGRFLFGES